MLSPQNTLSTSKLTAKSFSLKQELGKYTRNWLWFTVTTIAFLVAAFFYLRYTVPQYQVDATVMITDETEGGAPELAAFSDLGLVSSNQNKIENEIIRFKSRTLMDNVVKELKLNVQFFSEGRVVYLENYGNPLISVNFLANDSIVNNASTSFMVFIKSPTSFSMIDANGNDRGTFSFGESIELGFSDIVITPNTRKMNNNVGATIKVVVSPVKVVSRNYRNRLSVFSSNTNTSVINLSIGDPVKEKAADIINTLIKHYNIAAVEEKNQVALNTVNFIGDRLDIVYKDLSIVDTDAESFKASNRLTDISSEANLFLSSDTQNEARLKELNTQQSLVSYMKRVIQSQGDSFEPLPANLGLSEPSISGIIVNYNQLVARRKHMLKSSTLKNPIIVNLDQELNALKSNLSQSLNSVSSTISIQLSALQNQNAILDSKIGSVPKQQRELRDITRRLDTKEQIYLYLLEKREEAAISLAVTRPNSQVIDPAIAQFATYLSPNKKMIYAGALFLGLLLPFGVIYIKDLLDTKVHTREDLEQRLSAPVVGDIPSVKKKDRVVVSKTDRSGFAESFRILRTNLDFLLAGVKSNKGKTILVTSTIPGEGKTFVAANLAATLAMTGKKVVFVGTDLRNPKVQEFIDLPEEVKVTGLSNFIMKADLSPEDIIWKQARQDTFDVITSGAIPPNPAELLMQDRVGMLFEHLKENYDYVVVDTAPVSLVTDTILIGHFADLTMYLVRADHSDIRILDVPENLYKEKRLPNMAILLNATDRKRGYYGSYGYGYGYGYGKSAKK